MGRIFLFLEEIVRYNDDIKKSSKRLLLQLLVKKLSQQWKKQQFDWENSLVTFLPERWSISTLMPMINSTSSNSILVYKSSIPPLKWSLESTFLRLNYKSQWDCLFIVFATFAFSTVLIQAVI